MSLEILHVAERIDANARADDADDEHHDHAERIDAHRRGEFGTRLNGELEPQGHNDLQRSQAQCERAFVADRIAHDEDGDGEVDGKVHQRKRMPPFGGQSELIGARPREHNRERNREQRDKRGEGNGCHIARTVVFDREKQQCRNNGNDNEGGYQLHAYSFT